MAELKVVVIHNNTPQLAAGVVERNTEEFVAQENMKIIGALIGVAVFQGMDYEVLVQKSGTYKELGSYDPTRVSETQDYPMFDFKLVYESTGEMGNPGNVWQMLPQGSYFLIEKGERFYAHFKHNNGHATISHTSGASVVLFYY